MRKLSKKSAYLIRVGILATKYHYRKYGNPEAGYFESLDFAATRASQTAYEQHKNHPLVRKAVMRTPIGSITRIDHSRGGWVI